MPSVAIYRASGGATGGSSLVEPLPLEAATLDDATLQTAHGVYTVFRLYAGRRVIRLARHFARLRRSAELLGMPFPLADDWLRSALRQAVEAAGFDLARIRLTVPFDAPDTALITIEPFAPPPPALYEKGVHVGLVKGRRDSPQAKNSQFVEWRRQVQAQQPPPGIYEIALVNGDGSILEGLSSNFYAVLDGALRTAGDRVLEGIARSVLLDVAPDVLPVALEPIHVGDLPRVGEAMLTSASRGIVPVVQVGDVTINGGKPGPITAALRAAYEARVERELEAL